MGEAKATDKGLRHGELHLGLPENARQHSIEAQFMQKVHPRLSLLVVQVELLGRLHNSCMRAHVVFAHPEPHSLNGTLKNITLRVLQGKGYAVTCTDLFAENFSVYLDNKEFPGFSAAVYTVSDAQQHCLNTGTLPAPVQREQQLLVEADLIVFQFPMWWGTVPAPLKAYFEKVFLFNWSFGGAYNLQGKRTLVCSSVGTPEVYWSNSRKHSIKTVYYHLFAGLFETMKMINLQPIIIYGFEHMTDDQKRRTLADFEREILDVDDRPLLNLSE